MAVEGSSFPAVDVNRELNPGTNTNYEVDSVSAQVEKQRVTGAANEKKKREAKKDCIENLKTAIIVSGVILALAGAAFALTKKLKEKS